MRELLLQVLYTILSERLLKGDIAQAFFEQVLEQARAQSLLSEEHFTVDGACAGQKSFQRKGQPPQPPEGGDSNPTVNFHGPAHSTPNFGR